MNLNKYQINSNILKSIAIIAMIVDHSALWLAESGSVMELILRMFGRTAAPIMCYLIAEGFFHTSDNGRYLRRLLIFAVLSHFPYVLYLGFVWWQGTSVIWSLFLGLFALTVSQKKTIPIYLKVLIIIMCCLFAWTADWHYIAVLWVLAFGLFRGHYRLQIFAFSLIGFFLYLLPGLLSTDVNIFIRLGIFTVIPLLILYNGKRGRKSIFMKWGFYVIYPLHFLILYVLRYHLFG